jgi:hypothetical protein
MKVDRNTKTKKLEATCPFTLELFEADMISEQYNLGYEDPENHFCLFLTIEMGSFHALETTLKCLADTGWKWTSGEAADYGPTLRWIKNELVKNKHACSGEWKNTYKLWILEDHTVAHCIRTDMDCNACKGCNPKVFSMCNKSRILMKVEEESRLKGNLCELCSYPLKPLLTSYYCPLCD